MIHIMKKKVKYQLTLTVLFDLLFAFTFGV